MTAQEIRKAYLEFFASRGHKVINRAPLVLKDDPTTLFTGSGMQPMIPYLLGESHPEGKRIVDSQTCLRAQDIDDVGDNRHTTFFEMLGNWSMGDYFKEQQIEWMFEFLSDVVGLDMNKVYVTCFIGAPQYGIAKDTEAATVWQRLYEAKGLSSGQADIGSEADGYKRGIKPGERIFYYDGSKNWWSRNGSPETTPVGDPCGPDSEMFYDFGTAHNPEYGEFCHPNCDCGRFMEIGNNVFMAYRKVADGKFESLEQPNIDHGSGLERIAAAKLGDPDVFKISIMWPIIEKLEQLSGKKYDSHTNAMRVIADHLRTATFLAVDGCVPSNKEHGYVMRKFIRRAMVKAFDLGIEQNFMQELVPVIADLYHNDFPEVAENRDEIIAVLVKEEKAFRQTLRQGLKEFEKLQGNSMDSSTNFVFLHGFGGHGGKRWEGKLARELRAQGYVVATPQLPNTDDPREDEQVAFVLANCKFDEHTVLIGHSLGGAVAMKVLERLSVPIARLILVAPAIGEEFRTSENEISQQTGQRKIFLDNFSLTYDFSKVKTAARERIILSDNQETLRIPYLVWLSRQLNARLIAGNANKVHFLDDNEPMISNLFAEQTLTGTDIFKLYDTYGFPVELSIEEAFKQAIPLSENWEEEFDAKMKEQRERSQTASKGTFKGGLGGQTLQHKKYHTATHLMYQALRDVLGDHVIQRGSNITEERLRFDFSHDQKVTPEQLAEVERIVNEQIAKDLKVSFQEYPTKVAREEMGALGQFGDRYGDTVKVYKMIADGADKPFSFEICGGPHVDHTLQLFEDGKKFKIIKEEASSAGVRRIKAVLQ